MNSTLEYYKVEKYVLCTAVFPTLVASCMGYGHIQVLCITFRARNAAHLLKSNYLFLFPQYRVLVVL